MKGEICNLEKVNEKKTLFILWDPAAGYPGPPNISSRHHLSPGPPRQALPLYSGYFWNFLTAHPHECD